MPNETPDLAEVDKETPKEVYHYPYYFSRYARDQANDSEYGGADPSYQTQRDILGYWPDRAKRLAAELEDIPLMSPEEALRWATEKYALVPEESSYGVDNEYSTDSDAKEHQRAMLDVLHQRDAEKGVDLTRRPEATVVIPIAILDENQEVVLHTLDLVKQQTIAKGLEVVLWANYAHKHDDKTEEAKAKLQQLLEAAGDEITLRSMLVTYDDRDANLTMSKIRKDMMDILLEDAVERDFPFDHPVMWLDADILKMRPNTIELMANQVKEKPDKPSTPIAGARSYYSSEAEKAGKTPNIEKVAAVHELLRRHAKRVVSAFSEEEKERFLEGVGAMNLEANYIEEWGFTINLGTYAFLGGVNDYIRFDETGQIRYMFRSVKDELGKVLSKVYPEAGSLVGEPVEVAEARIYSSNRRRLKNLHNLAMMALRGPDVAKNKYWKGSPAVTYESFSHTDETRNGNGFDQDLDKETIDWLIDRFYSERTLGMEDHFENPSEALQEFRQYVAKILERSELIPKSDNH